LNAGRSRAIGIVHSPFPIHEDPKGVFPKKNTFRETSEKFSECLQDIPNNRMSWLCSTALTGRPHGTECNSPARSLSAAGTLRIFCLMTQLSNPGWRWHREFPAP
jgi:hypothetical protein